ncbi:MAG: phosphoenolpyruvate synthase, partial [Actinomycetota bacterium]|nr:phosphoenolpyruvate synthase [Actinomycetota bacterium]
MRDSLVRWLRDCRAADLGEVGGKVAHLAELRAAGLPTPDGFAIPASAYTDAIAAGGLEARLSDAEQRVAVDPAGTAAVAAQCQSLVRAMTLPDA